MHTCCAGSRPPAQLHAALDGHCHPGAGEVELDEEEQQEIQKIISEIHGNGERQLHESMQASVHARVGHGQAL